MNNKHFKNLKDCQIKEENSVLSKVAETEISNLVGIFLLIKQKPCHDYKP